MSVLEYVKELMLENSVIESLKTNAADEEKTVYSIEPEPTDPIVKRYFKGEAKKRFSFSLCTWRDSFTEEERLLNYEIYEKLVLWAESITRKKSFKSMGESKKALALKVNSNAYAMDEAADGDKMFYMIQCEFIYFEKGE